MPSCIKIHVGQFADDGTENCDFRNPDGTERLGAAQGDHHKTVFEIDPADAELVEIALRIGPDLNKLLSGAKINVPGIGVQIGARFGVWPGDGRS